MGIITWGGHAKLKVYDKDEELYGQNSAGPFMERECGLERNLANFSVNVKAPCIQLQGEWNESHLHRAQSDTILQGLIQLGEP